MVRDLENFHHTDAEAELIDLINKQFQKDFNNVYISGLMDLVNERSVETRNVLVEKQNRDGTWTYSVPFSDFSDF
jgi:hypothetical protein